MKIFLFLFLSLSVIILNDSFAESSDSGTEEIKKIVTIVHKLVDGKPVIEKQEVDGLFYVPPPPTLDGCNKTAGWVPWNPDSQHSKIMPDLQEQIDEGYDELCIVIVLPFEGKFFGKGHDLDVVLTNLDSVTKFLEDNDAIIEKNRLNIREYVDSRSLYIGALVPTSLISELVDRNDVVSIDMYGKMPLYPWHVTVGFDSKIYPTLQAEINSGKEQIPIVINFPYKYHEPSIQAGYYLTTSIPFSESEIEQMQEPVLMLLENNDGEVIYTSNKYIIANVPTSLILELEKIDDIISMAVFFDTVTSATAGSPSTEELDNQLSPIDDELTVDIELTVDSAKLSISGNALNLKEISIPYELLDKKLDVTINNIAESDFEILSMSDGPLLVFKHNALQSTLALSDISDDNSQFKSPLQQIHEGISLSDIQCNDDLILVKKTNKNFSACVTQPTAEKLTLRGWAE